MANITSIVGNLPKATASVAADRLKDLKTSTLRAIHPLNIASSGFNLLKNAAYAEMPGLSNIISPFESFGSDILRRANSNNPEVSPNRKQRRTNMSVGRMDTGNQAYATLVKELNRMSKQLEDILGEGRSQVGLAQKSYALGQNQLKTAQDANQTAKMAARSQSFEKQIHTPVEKDDEDTGLTGRGISTGEASLGPLGNLAGKGATGLIEHGLEALGIKKILTGIYNTLRGKKTPAPGVKPFTKIDPYESKHLRRRNATAEDVKAGKTFNGKKLEEGQEFTEIKDRAKFNKLSTEEQFAEHKSLAGIGEGRQTLGRLAGKAGSIGGKAGGLAEGAEVAEGVAGKTPWGAVAVAVIGGAVKSVQDGTWAALRKAQHEGGGGIKGLLTKGVATESGHFIGNMLTSFVEGFTHFLKDAMEAYNFGSDWLEGKIETMLASLWSDDAGAAAAKNAEAKLNADRAINKAADSASDSFDNSFENVVNDPLAALGRVAKSAHSENMAASIHASSTGIDKATTTPQKAQPNVTSVVNAPTTNNMPVYNQAPPTVRSPNPFGFVFQ